MALAPGTRLGAYEVLTLIGSGGMGEVYRARDSKLNRDVAIKVLPAAFASDPDRLARFRREAQVLASLNHPNIGAIYGFEESDGVQALALELVEGPTLADRIARGPMPLDEALPVAKQIAEALEAAHEQGIVHRDLKPANIKLRPDGTVKVLDFGLAKLADPVVAGTPSAANVTASPTIMSPAMTSVGVLLGTAAYMSPEQARGKAIDKRADIWAFGCVLFEMLSGARPFDGDTVTDTLAAVVKEEPAWATLPAGAPGPVRELLRRCLEKDPRQRLRDIGEARVMLSSAGALAIPVPARPRELTNRWRTALILAVIAAAAGYTVARVRSPAPATLPRLALTIPVHGTAQRDFAAVLSPDGQKIAYLTDEGVWLRRLSDAAATKLYDDELAARVLFWSPDSAWVGIGEADTLLKIPADGGAPIRIADISGIPGPLSAYSGAAAWLPDGQIIFTTGFTGLMSVPASGGEPVVWSSAVSPTEDLHGASALPDGSIVTAVHAGPAVDSIAVVRGTSRTIVYHAAGQSFSPPIYSATGHLVFARNDQGGGIWALPFDVASLKATGSPVLVEEHGAMASASADGRLLLTLTASGSRSIQLTVVDRQGASTAVGPVMATNLSVSLPALSPDGRRVLNGAGTGEQASVWLYDLPASETTQLTTGEPALWGGWWPDGKHLLVVTGTMRCLSGDCFSIHDRSLDGSADRTIAKGFAPDVSPDGKTLAFTKRGQGTEWDVATARLDSADAPQVLQGGKGWQFAPKFSPDGRFVAYVSNETGRYEVFVARYPSGGKWRVTTAGGFWPRWRADGERLYFARGSTVYEVPVRLGDALSVGTPVQVLPQGMLGVNNLGWPYGFDVSRDGQRFIVQRSVEPPASPSMLLMQNWAPR